MRRPFVAGNWKMHLDRQGARDLAAQIAAAAPSLTGVDLAVCPPYPYLATVAEVLRGSTVRLGAQDGYHEPKGAFTGAVSMAMLVDVGCQLVILGHSERRLIFGESNALVNKKIRAALAVGLHPILCIGEQLFQRDEHLTLTVVREQLTGSLEGVSPPQMGNVTIAYEPVWAIGTGKVATPEQAQEVHHEVRHILQELFGPEVAQNTRIQYGGSVKASNARDLLRQPDIDGALVGGASLEGGEFLAIAREAMA